MVRVRGKLTYFPGELEFEKFLTTHMPFPADTAELDYQLGIYDDTLRQHNLLCQCDNDLICREIGERGPLGLVRW